jgi:hypothetical protein
MNMIREGLCNFFKRVQEKCTCARISKTFDRAPLRCHSMMAELNDKHCDFWSKHKQPRIRIFLIR